MSRMLRGYDVDVVQDGQAALDKCRESTYDLIFCDVGMARMTGTEFHRALAHEQPEEAAKIVFMTGDAVSPAFVDFLERTSNAALEKPFDVASVHALLKRRLG